jgi:Na+/phosphate symporter
MRTTKDITIEFAWHLASWAFSFAMIYWLATDNLWLCFFISSSISGTQFAISSAKREILEMLLPMSQSYDDNINNLYKQTQSLEDEIDELKTELRELKNQNTD